MGVTEAIIGGVSMLGSAAISKPKSVAAPRARSYGGELNSALDGQEGIQDRLIGLERKYTPQYQELQRQTLMGQMGTLDSLFQSAMPMSARLGQQGLDTMSPLYARAGQEAMGAYGGMIGGRASGLMNTMLGQAEEELALGGQLSAAEQMRAEQASRAASGARGLQFGNQAIASEVLAGYGLSQQRQNQRRQFAGDVYGRMEGTAMNAYNMYGLPLMNQMNAYTPAGMLGTAGTMSAGLGPTIFNPESQYMADVMGSNQSNTMQTNIANSQARAGFGAGLMNMVGTVGGAYLKNQGLAPSTSTVTQGVNVNDIAKQLGLNFGRPA